MHVCCSYKNKICLKISNLRLCNYFIIFTTTTIIIIIIIAV